MTDDTDLETILQQLEELPRALLAARIEVARRRKFRTSVDAQQAYKMRGWKQAPRTYYSHESGERWPGGDIVRYSILFEVPVSFFLFGGFPEISDEEVAKVAARKARQMAGRSGKRARKLRVRTNEGEASPLQVNQITDQFNSNTSHNAGYRPIVVLSASEIRERNKTGRGGPTVMSGQQTILVPQSLLASVHSYAYVIPPDDLAMVAEKPPSFTPGTHLIADPERPIPPGKLVLVDHADYPEPLFRIYKASRPYVPGTPFRLEALNRAYEEIQVDDPGKLLSIARIISSVHNW